MSQGLEIPPVPPYGNERFNRRNRFTRRSDFSTFGIGRAAVRSWDSSRPTNVIPSKLSVIADFGDARQREHTRVEKKEEWEKATGLNGDGRRRDEFEGWRALSAGNRTRVATTDSYIRRRAAVVELIILRKNGLAAKLSGLSARCFLLYATWCDAMRCDVRHLLFLLANVEKLKRPEHSHVESVSISFGSFVDPRWMTAWNVN